jgi:hypothetical protein
MAWTPGGMFPYIEGQWTEAQEPMQDFQRRVETAVFAATGGTGIGVPDPGSNGLIVRTGAGSSVARTLMSASSDLTVADGNGVSGNPTLTLGANVPRKASGNVFTQDNTFNRIGLLNTAPSSVAAAKLSASEVAAGNYGLDFAVSGSADVDNVWRTGLLTTTWTGSGSSFHSTLETLTAYATHSGVGRVDSAAAVWGSVINNGGGVLQEPSPFRSQIVNSSGTMGQGYGFDADIVQTGTASVSTYVAMFRGRYRHIAGSAQSCAKVHGMLYTLWSIPTGSVAYSSVMEVDASVDIGTDRWMIHSLSTSPSLFSGDITTTGLGIGSAPLVSKPFNLVKTLSLASTSPYGTFVSVTSTGSSGFNGLTGGRVEATLASTNTSSALTGFSIAPTWNAALAGSSMIGYEAVLSVNGSPGHVYGIWDQATFGGGAAVTDYFGHMSDVIIFGSASVPTAYGHSSRFRAFSLSGGSIGNAISYYSGNWGTTGIVNGYGLYIDSTGVDRATGAKWAIYSLATAPSKLSGQLQGTSLTLTTALAGAYGGTGSIYVTFNGPTAPRVYTLPDTSTYIATTDGTGVSGMLAKFSPSGSPLAELVNSQIMDDGVNIMMGNLSFPAFNADPGSWVVSLGDEMGRQNHSYMKVDDLGQLITIEAMGINIATTMTGASVNIATTGGVISVDGANNSGFATDGGGTTIFGDWNGAGSGTLVNVSDGAGVIFLQAGSNQLSYNGPTLGCSSALSITPNGSLTINPTGNTVFNTSGKRIDPLVNYDQNLGQLSKKYLTLHAAELWVETLVAQNTIATIGGRIIVAPTNTLIADMGTGATTMDVKYNNMVSGDRLYMESNGSVEFFAVTSGASAITGGFRYSVTRNLDGTGANQWYAGDAAVDTGQTGSGFIDIYSVRGVKSASQAGPTIVGNIRNSATYNDWSEHWAIGNLNGLYGYGSDTPGIGLGKYAAGTSHITVDVTNGIRMFSGTATVVGSWAANGDITVGQVAASQNNVFISGGVLQMRNNTTARIQFNANGSGFLANSLIAWDTSGNVTITGNAVIGGVTIGSGKMYVGTGTFNNTNTGFYVDSAGQFSLKDKLSWNATTLSVNGTIVTTNGSVAAWTIGATRISSTNVFLDQAGQYLSMGTTPPTSYGSNVGMFLEGANAGRMSIYKDANNFLQWDGTKLIWKGANTSLDASGNLTATSGTFSGAITATSGSISGLLTMTGASSAITMGLPGSGATFAPTSATFGTGIWMDRTGIYGLSSSTLQAKFDAATGRLTAGAGAVILDAGGLTLSPGTGSINQINWGSTVYIRAVSDGTVSAITTNSVSAAATILGMVSLKGGNSTDTYTSILDLRGDGLNNRSYAQFYGSNFSGLVLGSTIADPATAMLDVRGQSRFIKDGTYSVGTGAGRFQSSTTGNYYELFVNPSSSGYCSIQSYQENVGVAPLLLNALGGSVVVGWDTQLATNATAGFLYIPTTSGTPTGIPGAFSARVAMLYDTSANKLWIYNGAWRSATFV